MVRTTANVIEKSYPVREERFIAVDAPTICTLMMKACNIQTTSPATSPCSAPPGAMENQEALALPAK